NAVGAILISRSVCLFEGVERHPMLRQNLPHLTVRLLPIYVMHCHLVPVARKPCQWHSFRRRHGYNRYLSSPEAVQECSGAGGELPAALYFSTTLTRSATRHPHLVSRPVPTVSSHRLGQLQLTPLQNPLASRVLPRF